MTKDPNSKKRVVTSYQNLAPELQDELKKRYPTGFTEAMIRIEKGAGSFFYAVVFETDQTNYLVKVDVKIGTGNIEEEEDKEFYDDDVKGDDEIIDSSDDSDDE